ncbi:MAG: hypothetical protein D3923_05365 [Candidatus Electrothrix sp. AR3]|nr:hypothetical protein [Candidatus Electrothrix sp. AR3]
MNKLLSYTQGVSTGRIVFAFFVPAMAIYFVMVFYTIPQVEAYAQGMKLFDLSPLGYSFEYASELLQALGNEGREKYLYRQLPLDFLYPGLFAVSCTLLLTWLFLKTSENKSKIFYLCLVPAIAGVFDYLENICVVHILWSYPSISKTSIALASTMTIAKSALTTIFFVLLLLGTVLFFIRERNNKKNQG